MNKIFPIVVLFGGLTIFSGALDKAFTASSSSVISSSNKVYSSIENISQSNLTPEKQIPEVIQAGLNYEAPAIREAKVKEISAATEEPFVNYSQKKFILENMNGIELNDDITAVIQKLGQPVSREKDAFLGEMEVLAYPNMNIGFSYGVVSYVEVLVAAETVKIDSVSISIDEEALINAMGKPDFVAQDGIVFQRHEAIVKLFKDMETHKVTAIHYYHHADI